MSENQQLVVELEQLQARADELDLEVTFLRSELTRTQDLLNTPQLHDFSKAVVIEAAHQRQRWGGEHDAGKTPQDWFWLVGYLAGKALQSATAHVLPRFRHRKRGTVYQVISIGEDENRRGTEVVVYRGEDDGKIWVRPSEQFFDGRFEELPRKPSDKALHHVITTAAACANWHAAMMGTTNMRPGLSAEQQTLIDPAVTAVAATNEPIQASHISLVAGGNG